MPITVEISKDPLLYNKYYYGDSDLIKRSTLLPTDTTFYCSTYLLSLH